VTVQAVSKHLKVLANAGLVSRSREAQRRPVHLEAQVFDLMSRWIERYRAEAEAKIIVDQLVPLGRITRDFDAPPAKVFRAHTDPEVIVQTFTFDGQPDGVALERLIFEDLGDGRTRLTTTSLVDSFADCDAFVTSGMEEGVREGYERLYELLAG
jgi:hypothetical protein